MYNPVITIEGVLFNAFRWTCRSTVISSIVYHVWMFFIAKLNYMPTSERNQDVRRGTYWISYRESGSHQGLVDIKHKLDRDWSNLLFFLYQWVAHFIRLLDSWIHSSKWIDHPSIVIICDRWEIMLQFRLKMAQYVQDTAGIYSLNPSPHGVEKKIESEAVRFDKVYDFNWLVQYRQYIIR